MRVNLISNIDENSRLEAISAPSQIYAWFLHKAFAEEGVDVRLISVPTLLKETPPEADYTVVILSVDSIIMLKEKGCIEKLRSSTARSLTCYANTDEMRWGVDQYFDYCFTQIEPRSSCHERYVCVGWGVDPTYSYPEQSEKAALLDSKVLRRRMRHKVKKAYQIYDDVLPKLNIKTHNPVSTYGSGRVPYPEYQSILRKCHYFLCTQFGEGGLNRLEAAACGALLVVPPNSIDRKPCNFSITVFGIPKKN